MILVDLSSIFHRKIHTSINDIKPNKTNGVYNTEEFIYLTKHHILDELFTIKREHENNFNEIVICLDKSVNGYWRTDFYSNYKNNRKKGREESEVNFKEVFTHLNDLIEQIKNNLPWKVIEVPKAEADDIMLVLAKEFNDSEKILIHSPDKDMLQAQRGTNNVYQYSSLTKKWLSPETKSDDMESWIIEHVCLGDASDDVPKIVDGTEFSQTFIDYLIKHDIPEQFHSPYNFKNSDIPIEVKTKILTEFDVYKTNKKGESTDVKDVYKTIRFGVVTLNKSIDAAGSLDEFLDSNPLYRDNYNRNYVLVMEEGIPDYIREGILKSFKDASADYNAEEFEEYLKVNNLNNLLMEIPSVFKLNRELTADDFGW